MNTIYIYGFHPVNEAINSAKNIDKIFLQKGLHSIKYKYILYKIKIHKIPFQFVTKEKLRNLTLKNHQGIFAFISPIIFHKINDLIPTLYENGKNPLLLVVDRITNVRNFGSIARTAECGGVDAVIYPSKGSTGLNSDAIKASSGGILRIPFCKELDLYKSLINLKNFGIQVIAATEKSSTTLYEVDFSLPMAIIIGNEQYGINYSYLSLTDKKIKIPMFGNLSSMNVSVVCGVFIYEIIRKRYAKIA